VSLVVLDTDVSSQSLRGRLPGPLKSRLAGETLAITFVTLGELVKWTRLRSWGPQRLAGLDRWMQHAAVLPYDPDVAIAWGDLQARAQLRGRPRPVNDTWIAACCLVHQIPLATFNLKDFEDFAQHDGLLLFDGSR
jgi:predicted nucleic acid-binding protein